jgi:hypothetical protein
VQVDEVTAMTLEQLEERVHELERQVAELRTGPTPLRPMGSVEETFGMFADDPEFDEIVRLGREYRNQVNAEDEADPRHRSRG